MPTRIGFIGASVGGSWADRAHMPYFNSPRAKEQRLYEIAAIQNSSIASAERASKHFGFPEAKPYDSPEALASDPDVDLVAVSIKVPSHRDAILPALNAGKDVFVEWPLARNLSEAEELTSLAQKKGVKTLVGLQARQNPSVVAAKKLIEAGELGEIIATTMYGYGLLYGDKVTTNYVYTLPIEHGANILTIPAGHAIDALCWVLGELDSLQATLANHRPEFDIVDAQGKFVERGSKTSHDFVAVSGTLERGGGSVNVVYQGGNNPTGGPGFRWQIDGTKGSLLLESKMGHVQMFGTTIKMIRNGEKELKEVEGVKSIGDDFSYSVGQAWEAFAGVGDGCVTTWEHALVRHRMIDAIYRSNENGTRERYL